MVTLGEISVGNGTSPYRVGGKLMHLAEELGFSEVEAARMAAAVAEAVRILVTSGGDSRIEVIMDPAAEPPSLRIRFHGIRACREELIAALAIAFGRVGSAGSDPGTDTVEVQTALSMPPVSFAEDFLARERSELELLSEEELVERLLAERGFSESSLNALSDVFVVFDPEGRLLKWNRRLNEISGMIDAEIGQRRVQDFFAQRNASLPLDIDTLCEGAQSGPFTVKATLGVGKEREQPVELAVSVFRAQEGSPEAFCAIARDMTAHERLEADLASALREAEEAKDRAEAADRLKSAFLATMSHELRTPLNSIIGFTGILLQGLAGPLGEEQVKQLGMVRKSAEHLLSLINDILDISKIEAGQLEISPATFDVKESVEKVVSTIKPALEEKGLSFSVDISPRVATIECDRRRMEQVLLNLLGNAVKFTEEGGVELTCDVEGGRLRCDVRDTGPGIRREDMEKLFQPFRQLDMRTTRTKQGTGLGLSICKRLVELMGGEIWVESEYGKGSTFSFSLPLKPVGAP